MTALALLALVSPLQYSFEPGTKLQYDTKITFEGFIPILGGNEGTVVVDMAVAVDGLEGKGEKVQRAASEITSFRVTFNDAPLPLDVTSVQTYFPRTTISLSPWGKIIESDAPDVKLPVRLPGLDVKRFPDVTYVPIQFPEQGAKVGESWTFTKNFGGSEIKYDCRLKEMRGAIAIVAVTVRQEFVVLEDAALEVVTKEADAERRNKTVMQGSGTVRFDTERGVATRVDMVNEAVSEVTKLSDGSKSERRLKTTAAVVLKETPPPAKASAWWERAWGSVKAGASRTAALVSEGYALARLAFKLAVANIPGLAGIFDPGG